MAFNDFNGELESFNIYSNKPIEYITKHTEKQQLVIFQNQGSSTFAKVQINGQTHYSASWMGSFGYYVILLPPSKSDYTITLTILDSAKNSSKVGVKTILLPDNPDLIKTFNKLSQASNLRYQHYIGGIDNRESAIEYFESSIPLFIQYNLQFYAALSSFEVSITLDETNQHFEAIEYLNKAVRYWNNTNFKINELQALNKQGLIFWKISRLKKAIEIFKYLLIEYNKLEQKELIAITLNNIGLIHWDKGQISLAKNSYIKSLKTNDVDINLLSNIPLTSSVAATLNNLALAHDALGETQKAESLWKVHIEKFAFFSNPIVIAKAKNNLATLYLNNGKYDLAKKYLDEAIAVFTKVKNKKWQSLSLYNLGRLYLKLGIISLAEIQFLKSVSLVNKNDNPKDIIQPKLKLIEIYTNHKKYQKSKRLSKETFKIASKIKNPKIIALLNLNDFQISLKQKDYYQARISIDRAIESASDKILKRYISNLYINKAQLFIELRDYNSAIKILKTEVKNLKNIWDTTLLNTANNLLAQAYIKNTDLSNAEITINNEIDNLNFYISSSTSDKIRSDLSRMLKETLGIYNIISTLQEKSKLGFIKTNQMLSTYRAFKKKNNLKQSELSQDSIDDLLIRIKSKSLALENNKLSSDDKKQIQNDIIELKAKLDFSYSATTSNDSVNINIQKIQDTLDDDALIIQFSTSDAGGVSWWISKDKFESHIIADKDTLTELVTEVRKTLLQQNNSIGNINKLSKQLIEPLVNYKSSKKILLLLDEPLNLIPFNALSDPRFEYKYPIANTSSVQRMSSIDSIYNKNDNSKKDYSAIVIADPVTSEIDARLNGLNITNNDIQSFDRLLGTKSEARNISKLINSHVLQGFDANKSNLFATNFKNTSILHFATHAFFHPEISGLSSLVLSSYDTQGNRQQSSFLRALEISNLDLNNELVILSGCETGVGIEDNSLGLNGLTQSFMQAGAKNLIASLWKVDDHITQKMMTEFYRGYTNGLTISDSLKQAQKLIKDNPRTRHPKYWAGWFLLSN